MNLILHMTNDRFGSLAAVETDSNPMTALGRKADTQQGECPLSPIPDIPKL
jgi:hypothetical protein